MFLIYEEEMIDFISSFFLSFDKIKPSENPFINTFKSTPVVSSVNSTEVSFKGGLNRIWFL